MTNTAAKGHSMVRDERELSLAAVGSAILRRRRLIGILAILGGLAGFASGIFSARVYRSSATFVPEGADEQQPGGLAAAASQFGIRLPTQSGGSNAWGPAVYVDLLQSPTLLQPIVEDSVSDPRAAGRRIALLDLLDVKGDNRAIRVDEGIMALQRLISVDENKDIGAVELSITTKWPRVSMELAQALIAAVNKFNMQKRRSAGTAEREFATAMADEAEQSLRAAEDRLQQFMQQNLVANSPSLTIQRERLQRDVTVEQQVYTSLLQSREEARIREVRDTPAITMLEDPRYPAVGEPRKSVQKGILGAFAGAVLAALLALIAQRLEQARATPSVEGQEFLDLLRASTPSMLRRLTP